MVVNGMYVCGKSGRPTEKVKNLRRFAEQWTEFSDVEALKIGEDDAKFIGGALHLGERTLDKYHQMANELEA